jgi:hypothetical protein
VGERKCTDAVRRGRLAKAEQFERSAQLILKYASGADDLNDAYITLCVHAGIAAADVLCCRSLGRHNDGENHNAAIKLLGQVDKRLAGDLETLLKMKTASGYGAVLSSATARKRSARAVERLMDAARVAGR